MRFKVSIEYIQTTDPDDFYKMAGGKKSLSVIAEYIEKYLKSSIESAIQAAVEGHGYSLGNLEESLKYAAEDGLIKITAKYLDDNWTNDKINMKKVL